MYSVFNATSFLSTNSPRSRLTVITAMATNAARHGTSARSLHAPMDACAILHVAIRAITLGNGMPIHTSSGAANSALPNPTELCAATARQIMMPARPISSTSMFNASIITSSPWLSRGTRAPNLSQHQRPGLLGIETAPLSTDDEMAPDS